MVPPPPTSTLFPYTTLFRSTYLKGDDRRAALALSRALRAVEQAWRSGEADPQALQRRGMQALTRSEEHTSELQSLRHLVCRLLLEKKNDPGTSHRGRRHQTP